MPSSTSKQARTMAAAAHDPKFAKKMGIPQSTAREFNQHDAGTDMMHQAMMERARSTVMARKMKEKHRA